MVAIVAHKAHLTVLTVSHKINTAHQKQTTTEQKQRWNELYFTTGRPTMKQR